MAGLCPGPNTDSNLSAPLAVNIVCTAQYKSFKKVTAAVPTCQWDTRNVYRRLHASMSRAHLCACKSVTMFNCKYRCFL